MKEKENATTKTSYHLRTDGDKLVLYSLTGKEETIVKEIPGGSKLSFQEFEINAAYWVEDGKIKKEMFIDGSYHTEDKEENVTILTIESDGILAESNQFIVEQHIRQQDLKGMVRYTVGIDSKKEMVLTCRVYDDNGKLKNVEYFLFPDILQPKITFKIDGKDVTYTYQTGEDSIIKQQGETTSRYIPSSYGHSSGHELLVKGTKVDLSIMSMNSYKVEARYSMICTLNGLDNNLHISYNKGGKRLRTTLIELAKGAKLRFRDDLYEISEGKVMQHKLNAEDKIQSSEAIENGVIFTGRVSGNSEIENPFTVVPDPEQQVLLTTNSDVKAQKSTGEPNQPPEPVKLTTPQTNKTNQGKAKTLSSEPVVIQKTDCSFKETATPAKPDHLKLAESFVKLLFPEDKTHKERIFIAKPSWRNKVTTGNIMNKFIKDLSDNFAKNEDIITKLSGMNDDAKQNYANKIVYAFVNIEFKDGKGAIFTKNNGETKWQNIIDFITCAFRSLMNMDYSIMDNYFKGKSQVIVTNPTTFQGFLEKIVSEKEGNENKSKFAKEISKMTEVIGK